MSGVHGTDTKTLEQIKKIYARKHKQSNFAIKNITHIIIIGYLLLWCIFLKLLFLKARMVSPGGRVFGIDVVPSLVQWSRENVMRAAPDLLQSGVLTLEGKWQVWFINI